MKKYHDPITGDELTKGEYISWQVQGLIRRWYFLIAISIITVIVWSTNNQVALLWWNLGASYLAILIESVVGLAMFGQTRRDAVALREVRNLSKQIEKQEELILQLLEQRP